MVWSLKKWYILTSYTYFSQVAVPELHENGTAQVETELSPVEYYAASTELWSSWTTEPDVSLTVYFINEEFQLKSPCLQTVFFLDDHTSGNIATGMRKNVACLGP